MGRRKILFQGSYSRSRAPRSDSPDQAALAEMIALSLGECLIDIQVDLIFTGDNPLERALGDAATAACKQRGEHPRERLRTFRSDSAVSGFGMILEIPAQLRQDLRTFAVREADAVIALGGNKGTRDCIQKAVLAGKPVIPIAVAGGGAQAEWLRLKQENYRHHITGDIDFLGDHGLGPDEIAAAVAQRCTELFAASAQHFSNRIFIVHGRDGETKTEVARLLERLGLVPVVLAERPDNGRTILGKLGDELADVGYAIILLTPDDVGRPRTARKAEPRARQNVIFEHGWLIGTLGTRRVCAIVKDSVEIPSDLAGLVYKHIPAGRGVDAVAIQIVQELQSAGYTVDANKVFSS